MVQLSPMRVLFTLLLLVWFASPAYAYSSGEAVRSKQTAASLVVDRASITAGQPFWIALRLELNDGWHTYWKNSGDSGIPTTLELTLPEGFKAGDIQWPTPERLVLSGIVNYGYSKEAWHFVEITPPASLTSPDYTIKATAAWLACADICIPEHAELSLELPVSSTPVEADSDFREKLTTVPSVWKGNATYSTTIDAFDLTIPEPHLGDALAFFPLQNGVISNEKPPVISRNSKGLTLHFVRGETPLKGDYQGVLQDITLGNAYAITATQGTDGVISPSPASKAVDSVNNITLGAALLLAFGGGLLLNLMPCVLPVLSLKALSLVRMKDHTRVHALRHGLAYTAGVVLSFVSFAIALILLQQAGAEIGWGFQLQSPAFVAGLSLLMLLVGLNLSGVFELPVLFGNTGPFRNGAAYRAWQFYHRYPSRNGGDTLYRPPDGACHRLCAFRTTRPAAVHFHHVRAWVSSAFPAVERLSIFYAPASQTWPMDAASQTIPRLPYVWHKRLAGLGDDPSGRSGCAGSAACCCSVRCVAGMERRHCTYARQTPANGCVSDRA